jgi:hypothetical protein
MTSPVLGRLRQENHEFKARLGYKARPYLKKKKKKKDMNSPMTNGVIISQDAI